MTRDLERLFKDIYNKHYPMVMQMCLGYMKGSEDDAKDLMQEVFVNIWNALGRFRGESAFKTWIYRITVNTCLQHIKSTKKRNEVSLPASQHSFEEPNGSTTVDLNKELYKAIGELEEVDRLVVMMMLEDQDYDEIASTMGISPGNLRVRIHRIKKKLKELIRHE